MKINDESQLLLQEFVDCCLTLNEVRITNFLDKNPSLIKVSEYICDEIPFIDSIKEIFNEFKANSPLITVAEKELTNSICGDLIILFSVSFKENSELNSSFGFLIKLENETIVEISEYSKTKSYISKINKRVFGGLNEQEIIELKEAINNLPDLASKCNCK